MADNEPTPAEIAAFVDRLAYWKVGSVSPSDITLHNYPVAEGRTLGHAKRALERMQMWSQGAGQKIVLEGLIAMLVAKLKTAVVEGDRVEFRFLGSELIELRAAAGHLQDYALIRERDAREASRPRYPKRKH